MHSIVFVLLPPDTADILKKARELLAPYDQNLELPPYKDYLTNEQIRNWIQKFGIMSLDALAARLTEEFSSEVGVDAQGLYENSTFNRNGHWDYWHPTKFLPRDPKKIECWGKDLAQSVCLVHELPAEKNIPHSLVTPDGKWHDIDGFGYKTILQYEKGIKGLHPQNVAPTAKWEKHAREILAACPHHLVLILDCHS